MPIGLKSQISKIPYLGFLSRKLFGFFIPEKFKFVHVLKNGPASGLTFNIELPGDKNILIGNYELDFTRNLINSFSKGDVFYDIGGFKGYFSGLLALKGAKEVHVFEPMPNNIGKIKDLIALNPFLPIHLHEVAISDQSGISTFQIMKDDSMGKLEDSNFQREEKGEIIKVRTISLDSLVFEEKISPPNLIKIDVEGAESYVLKGAKKTLEIYSPILLIEIHGYLIGKTCLDFLNNYNYQVTVIETQKPPSNSEAEICHYLCRPKSKNH